MIRQPIDKIDGMAAVMGKPMYVDDLKPEHCLFVKVLRSPHAYAEIQDIRAEKALALPGVACVLTHRDVPQKPMTFAAEASPEGSPHDRTVLERIVRFVGEPVAVVAAETEQLAEQALDLIDVMYRVMEPNLDFETAIDNGNPIYTKDQVFNHWDVWDNGNDFAINRCARKHRTFGDIEKTLSECDIVMEGTFRAPAQAHAMMETHRAFCYKDMRGKLVIYSSAQSIFHVQRLVTEGLGLPPNSVRAIKPKVGGAFGGKNSIFIEPLVALVTHKTGRPAILNLTRQECFTSTNTRHAFRCTVKLGADRQGVIKGIDVDMLTNAGAHGEHSFDVLQVACNNTLPIYGKVEALHFWGQAAYTNMVPAGAFRGFGGPQSTFSIEGAVSDLAYQLKMDPCELRLKNIIHENEKHPFVAGEVIRSCSLDRMIQQGREMIGWDEKYPCRRIDDHTIRAVGMSIAMHGSGIWGLDSVNATINFNYDGCFTLFVGACDLGTGGDTVLLQIAAETLGVPVDRINIVVSDSDLTPYDKGAYASSTTYVTGNAVKIACEDVRKKMFQAAAKMYERPEDDFIIDADFVRTKDGALEIPILQFAETICRFIGVTQPVGVGGWKCPVSPPPYAVGFVELDVDTQTGAIKLLDYVELVDCGTVINPKLARIQAEGGVAQGIGYTLYEDVHYNQKGKMLTDSLIQYRIPTKMDLPRIRTAFIESYEPSGPYGAKSMGEVVFHTPAAAIREAVLHATGVSINTLPITPEKVLMGILENESKGVKLPC